MVDNVTEERIDSDETGDASLTALRIAVKYHVGGTGIRLAADIAEAILAERKRCAEVVRQAKALNDDERYLLGKLASSILNQ